MGLFARKSIDDLQRAASSEGARTLARTLGPGSLVALGIGAIIGTGIFVLTGSAAAQFAGPAVALSFMLAALACAFAGLCYAELASMIPIAGSAYTYAYATLGEIVAWIIGWDLILEYLFGAATVAVGWAGYFVSLLRDLGIVIPPEWANPPGVTLVQAPGSPTWVQVTPQLLEQLARQGVPVDRLPHATGVFNVVAALAILAVATLLAIGIKESARVNNAAVIIKVSVVLAFIAAGGWYLFHHPAQGKANWTPFIPPQQGAWGHYGWGGIVRAAGVVFFAYIGFDAVSTTAQEARHPQRDMPLGILGSLAICTVLYILVAGVLTALVPYAQLNVPEPIAVGIEATGLRVLRDLVKIGAIAGLSSVMLVLLLGQSRIFYAMSSDGLLPRTFAQVHPRFRTPFVATILAGVVCALVAGSLPIAVLGELVSIGTLLAFVIVCAGVWFLRVKEPARPRPFRTPLVPVVPILGALVCFGLMAGLPWETWARLGVWLVLGLAVYFAYGRKHTHVR